MLIRDRRRGRKENEEEQKMKNKKKRCLNGKILCFFSETGWLVRTIEEK
jgi:hypothetical protein